jgi:glycine/serine hydroxymethyltransferase
MRFLASAVVKVLNHIDDIEMQAQLSEEVKDLCSRFPVPGITEC